ncbi:MAG: hypothetical protein LUC93_01390 [Planctomycetaceae bacterium]|nr:hypothetical protein [Planctomycetaceae bacterium]
MNILFETVRRWRLPLVCLAWLLTILRLLPNREYQTFLSGGFFPILIAACAVLLPLTMLALVRRDTPQLGARETLATALVLLPLVYVNHARGAVLGSGALDTRYVGSGLAGGATGARATVGGGETLLDLYLDTEKFVGKNVSLVGMVAQNNPQVLEVLGESKPLLFRFVINCCAADATPVAVILDGDMPSTIMNDDWVQATGVFTVRNVGGQDLLVLADAAAVPVATPREPYLYMQWGVF